MKATQQLPPSVRIDWERVRKFARDRFSAPADLELEVAPLQGGLDSCGVFLFKASWNVGSGLAASHSLVVKRVAGDSVREVAVYEVLAGSPADRAVPRLLGVDWLGPEDAHLYFEYVRPAGRWPWRNHSANTAVLQQLACVHSLSLAGPSAFRCWDYDRELRRSAEQTIEVFSGATRAGLKLGDRPMLRALERTAATLPLMRRALQTWHPPVLLHGDAHAGNAIVPHDPRRGAAVLLDWGRSRLGSPLEDVSSWLQSVGYWEPEVRRRHDTLFRRYLVARGLPEHLSPELRELYWLAAASNAMAGAVRYHLMVMQDPTRRTRERSGSARAVADWLRIVRRADVCWRN
jgi:hypothetical protein